MSCQRYTSKTIIDPSIDTHNFQILTWRSIVQASMETQELLEWVEKVEAKEFLAFFNEQKRNMHIKDYNPMSDLHRIPAAIQKLYQESPCIHESPRGSPTTDSSFLDSFVCSKPEKLLKSVQVKNLLCTPVNRLVSVDVVFALSAWLCPIIFVRLATFRQGEHKTFGLGNMQFASI